MKIGDPYVGYAPSNVKRDAKYTLKRDDGGQWAVQVRYDEGNGWEYLLWSHAHPVLVQMVNAIKLALQGQEGGIFYINEFGHVLVPDPPGPPRYAGTYDQFVDFDYQGDVIGPVPPDDLASGDPWRGPHVGVAYKLTADGRDIYCRVKDIADRNRERKEYLSEHVGPAKAAALCAPFREIKDHGGRIYINEAGALFTPAFIDGAWEYLYLGSIEIGKDGWFPNPLAS